MLLSLPRELWIEILSLLTPKELAKVQRASHFFLNLARDDLIWYRLSSQHYHFESFKPRNNLPKPAENAPFFWYHFFQQLELYDHRKLVTAICFIGPSSAGKTCLIKHLYWNSGLGINKTKYEQEINSLIEQERRGGFRVYAKLHEVKNQLEKESKFEGIQQTVSFSMCKIETKTRLFGLVDAPGKEQYIKNFVVAVEQCDAAVLVVDAQKDFSSYEAQLVEMLRIAYHLKIASLIVAVNKMDLVNYSKKRFEEIKNSLDQIIAQIGYIQVKVIPISVFENQNVFAKPTNPSMTWWQGKQLSDLITHVGRRPRRNHPFRMVVKKPAKIAGIGTVVVGVIVSGSLPVRSYVNFRPTGINIEAARIECFHNDVQRAYAGEWVAVRAKGCTTKHFSRGDMCLSAQSRASTAKVESFIAELSVILPFRVHTGYAPSILANGVSCPCKLEEVLSMEENGTKTSPGTQICPAGSKVVVKMAPLKQMPWLEPDSMMPDLSRFLIFENRKLTIVGDVKEITRAAS